MDEKNIELIDKALDLVIISIALLQEISGKSREEILDAIKSEEAKTDKLLEKLR